jgi:hypothetical protein
MAGITSLSPTQPKANASSVISYKYQPTPIFTICRAIIKRSRDARKNRNNGYRPKKDGGADMDGKNTPAG